jgi:cyanate permease
MLISLMAIIVSILFVISGVAMARRWATTRRLIIVTGTLSMLVHVYGALPPHRNMGILVLIVGAGYGLLMLVVFEWNQKRTLVS